MNINDITGLVIGSAMAVHRRLGPGLLESAYETCMVLELAERGLRFQRQYPLNFSYRGQTVDCGYRLDFVVEDQVIVELKSVSRLLPIHLAQMLTYIKLTDCPVGLLINFNVQFLKHGLRRVVLRPPRSLPSLSDLCGE